jgi:hypothetical protein
MLLVEPRPTYFKEIRLWATLLLKKSIDVACQRKTNLTGNPSKKKSILVSGSKKLLNISDKINIKLGTENISGVKNMQHKT